MMIGQNETIPYLCIAKLFIQWQTVKRNYFIKCVQNTTYSLRKCCIANCSNEYFADGLLFNDDICSSVSLGSSLMPLSLFLWCCWWLLLLYCILVCCENDCCRYWWLGEPDLPFCSMWLIIASSCCCCNNALSNCCWCCCCCWCWCCCCCCWWWWYWLFGDDGDDDFVWVEWICASSRSIGTFSVCAAARAPDDSVDALDCAYE